MTLEHSARVTAAGGRIAAKVDRPTQRSRRTGQVHSFAAASAGPPPVPSTVNVQLADITYDDGSPFIVYGVPYLAPYAPTIGDWIWIDVSTPDWLVLGKQA